MSDQRRFTWKSGRLTSTPINYGWAIDRDSRDPSIPNLPLETAEAASESSSDSALAASFQTRAIRNRRSLRAEWIASMAPAAVQPAVVPASAWMVRPVEQRRETQREIIEAPALEWKYIAPTVAAILPAPKVIKIDFQRHVRVAPPLALYPATPPTGPPYPSWLAAAAFRVSHDKWLVQAPEQDSYPTAPVVPVDGNSIEAPFETRRIRGRKRLTVPQAPVYTQAATPFQWTPNDAPETLKRRETTRRLVKAAYPPVYPQPAAPPTVEFAAVSPVRSRRRRGGGGGSIAIDVLVVGEAGSTPTPAVYPSFLPVGYNKRRGIERKVQQAPEVIGVNAAAYTPSDDGVDATPFETRRIRGRKLLRQADIVGVEPAAPVTYPGGVASVTPAKAIVRRETRRTLRKAQLAHEFPATPPPPAPVVSAFTPVKTIRRRSLGQGFVTVDVVSGQVSAANPYQAFVPSGWFRRAELTRRHLQAIDAPSKPQTPPVPEQPPTAFKLAQAYIRARLTRKLREAEGPLHVEAAPAPVESPIVHRGGGRPRKRKAHYEERIPSQYKRLEEMVDDVSAEMAFKEIEATAPADVKQQAKSLLRPFTPARSLVKADTVDWEAVEADATKIGALLALWAAERRRLELADDDEEWMMWE